MGHVSKEFAFGTIGGFCLQHCLMRDDGRLLGLLFRLEQSEARISMFDQTPQPGTVTF